MWQQPHTYKVYTLQLRKAFLTIKELSSRKLIIPSFGWCRTFPPKEFEREPQNRLPLLPTARSYPLLPLTYGPSLLYWMGTGWWRLSLVRVPLLCMSKACLLLMHLPWFGGSFVHYVAHPWPLVRELFSNLPFFAACFLQGLGLTWLWVFLSLACFLLLP